MLLLASLPMSMETKLDVARAFFLGISAVSFR